MRLKNNRLDELFEVGFKILKEVSIDWKEKHSFWEKSKVGITYRERDNLQLSLLLACESVGQETKVQ